MAYADPKRHEGKAYHGMKVGGIHRWTYPDGHWTERKVEPDRWQVTFTSRKVRRAKAPKGSGAEEGSKYHWFIVAHQWADKLDANTYATHLEGSKYLVAFKKPGWRGWNTQQRGHKGARQKVIAALEDALRRLREASDAEFEDPTDMGAWEEMVQLQQEAPVEPVKEAKPARPPRPRRARKAVAKEA